MFLYHMNNGKTTINQPEMEPAQENNWDVRNIGVVDQRGWIKEHI